MVFDTSNSILIFKWCKNISKFLGSKRLIAIILNKIENAM